MQNKKNVSQLSIVLLTIVLFALPLRAQVTIGNTEAPHQFSLLELVADSKLGGLRLPQLTDVQCEELKVLLTSPGTSSEDKNAAKGLVVYNTKGCLYFWIGDDWITVCKGIIPSSVCIATPAQPGAIKGTAVIANGSNFIYSIDPVQEADNYTWTVPAGWAIAGSSGNSLTTTATSITVTPHIDLKDDGTIISVTANNACGVSEESVLGVSRCSAMISSLGMKKAFMCYNLGAIRNGKPFEPNAALNGDYYQFGYKYPSGTRDDLLGTPVNEGENIYPNPVAWSNDTPTPGVYGNGVANDLTTTTKSPTDPCPAGYRIPNWSEWTDVTNNARTNNPNDGSWPAGDDRWSGAMFGDALFLPAAGARQLDGVLSARGLYGRYWSSTVPSSSVSADYFLFLIIPNYLDTSSRSDGYSIRCIAE